MQSRLTNMKNKIIFSFEEELNLWGLQVKEHLLFIYQGLVEDLINPNTLRSEAAQLHNDWHKMLETNLLTTTNPKEQVLQLLEKTLDYQIKIKKLIENNIWVGLLSYSFVGHLISESNYFKKKIINPGYNLKEETDFWLLHHQTEIEASEKLLDPLEIELSEISKLYVDQVKELRADLDLLGSDLNMDELNDETQQVLNEYLVQTNSLKDGIERNLILTNISLPLINHVIREGERAIQIFAALAHY